MKKRIRRKRRKQKRSFGKREKRKQEKKAETELNAEKQTKHKSPFLEKSKKEIKEEMKPFS